MEIPGVTGSGRLFALEIDTEGAAAEFKTAIDDFLQKEQVRVVCMCAVISILSRVKIMFGSSYYIA